MVDLKPKRYDRDVPACSSLKALSRNLRRIRDEKGLTQEQVAERAELTYRHYQQIEATGRPGLQVATVERLAKALGATIADLFQAK